MQAHPHFLAGGEKMLHNYLPFTCLHILFVLSIWVSGFLGVQLFRKTKALAVRF